MTSKGNDKSEKKLDKPRFQEGERILCYHGPLIYEAKCVDIQSGENGHNYYIHYQGWNKSWDEWVQEERLLKFNEENLKMKDELFKNSKTIKKSSKSRRTSIGSVGDKEENNSRSNSPKPVTSRKSIAMPAGRFSVKFEKPDLTPTRKKKDFVVSPEREFRDNICINILLQDELRFLLIYDFELICKRKKVTKVPARLTVNGITEKYIQHKTSLTDSVMASKFKETAYAIQDYFNVIFAKKLLYAFEKPQYLKLVENKTNFVPSSMYGAVHLVRLFLKLGQHLAHLPIDDDATTTIEENVNDYVRYLHLNIGKFVTIDDYTVTSSDYQRKAKETTKN